MMQNALLVVVLLAAAAPLAAAAADAKETPQPYTTFQTGGGYVPEHDIRTDAVIAYTDSAALIKGWRDKGFFVQTMYGFRTGTDYIRDHAGEGQTDAKGNFVTCGPGSYYMVPTESRIKAAVQYFTNAINAGAKAVCPEEPEFFQQAGYSESFKQAWQDYYGEPWRDPASSIEARWKSERLKAQMEYTMVKSIVDAAEKQNPDVRRMVACHSAVTYYDWGIIYPHYECVMLPNLQEIIGQVWTGTARTPCRYEGKVEERTFETAYLEYSNLMNLVRGTGKRMWFLMDPLEDNGERTMEDYHSNYEKTLVASLLFPEVDAYEVMPWPNRIYGRVPDEFATEISTVINALEDMHNQKTVQYDMGTRGIATFVSDSMGWQRGAPHASDYDCFWGMTLPLVYKGVPVEVAQLERVVEKDYLKQYKVLLLSYDIMKPMKPEYNQAIAGWVKQGGVLVYVGDMNQHDAYNDLPEWWNKGKRTSPRTDLFARLGMTNDTGSILTGPDPDQYTILRDKGIGKGAVIWALQPPSYYASSPEAGEGFRRMIEQACKQAGLKYSENPRLGIRRGDYVAMRTFGEPKYLKGSYISVLDPKLSVVVDPAIAKDTCALYCDVTKCLTGSPKLLYSSSKVEKKAESDQATKLTLSGPLKTKGVARIFTGGKSVASVEPADAKVEPNGDTLLVTFDNMPEAVSVSVTYRP